LLPQLTLTYTWFAVGQSLSSAGTTFTPTAGTLKFEVMLGNWSFTNLANTLDLHLHRSVLPIFTSIVESRYAQNITTFILASGATITSTINLIGSCMVDSSTVAAMSFGLTELANVSGGLDLVLEFPHFYKTVSYDPDFSVTLGQSSSRGGDGGPGDLPCYHTLCSSSLLESF